MMAQDDLVVVGIDVAKDKVDACIRAFALRQVFPSAAQGHRKLIAWLRKHKVTKAVMEASGGYERDWAKVLCQAGSEVRIVDPKRVRSFALSAGRLAKNDAIDAEMIAWFAETFSEAPSQRHDAAHEELLALVKARKGLLDLKTRLQSQNEHAAPGPVQKAHARVVKSLATEIAKLEAAISTKIKATPDFAERTEIIESVPGFAETTSANLIAGMPELGQVSNKIAAALLGAAPYDDDKRPSARRAPHQGWSPLGPKRHLHALSRRSHPEQPGAQGLLSPPDCQGKTAEGCARCLHAQADHHPQQPDRATAKMGSQPLPAQRARLIALGLRPSAWQSSRPVSGRGQGRSRRRRGRAAPALSPADRRSTSSTVALRVRCDVAGDRFSE